MIARTAILQTALWAVVVSVASGQTTGGGWRTADPRVDRPAASAAAPTVAPAPMPSRAAIGAEAGVVQAAATAPLEAARPLTKVTEGAPNLPTTHGQVWREYDITPYTLRVGSTSRPEQALIDWILRETGYEAWHGEPLGLLSANKRSLVVYHTPAMQAVVAEIVDRFVASRAETHGFALRVITVDGPEWRSRMHTVLKPVGVQSAGAQAWLLEREDAAMLLADLRRRSDFREHSSPQLMVNNGQPTFVSTMRMRNYVRDVFLRAAAPGVPATAAAQPGQVEEGVLLEFVPLLSLDRRTIDAVVKCDVDQVERIVTVPIDAPVPDNPRQKLQVEVPQMSRLRFQERFRWPIEQVLLIGLGLGPMPAPPEASQSFLAGLVGSGPPRSEVLVFVESKGTAGTTATAPQGGGRSYHGRY